MQTSLSFASGGVVIAANLIYIVSILRGKSKPTRGSWITWAALDIALLSSMYAKDTLNGQIICFAISSSAIALLSVRWGKPGWTPIEKSCLVVLPFGLVLWWFTREANWNIFVSLSLIMFACWPTYESTWEDPTREDKTAWTLAFVSCVLMLPAIRAFTVEDAAQPIVFFLTQVPMMYLLWIRPRKLKLQ